MSSSYPTCSLAVSSGYLAVIPFSFFCRRYAIAQHDKRQPAALCVHCHAPLTLYCTACQLLSPQPSLPVYGPLAQSLPLLTQKDLPSRQILSPEQGSAVWCADASSTEGVPPSLPRPLIQQNAAVQQMQGRQQTTVKQPTPTSHPNPLPQLPTPSPAQSAQPVLPNEPAEAFQNISSVQQGPPVWQTPSRCQATPPAQTPPSQQVTPTEKVPSLCQSPPTQTLHSSRCQATSSAQTPPSQQVTPTEKAPSLCQSPPTQTLHPLQVLQKHCSQLAFCTSEKVDFEEDGGCEMLQSDVEFASPEQGNCLWDPAGVCGKRTVQTVGSRHGRLRAECGKPTSKQMNSACVRKRKTSGTLLEGSQNCYNFRKSRRFNVFQPEGRYAHEQSYACARQRGLDLKQRATAVDLNCQSPGIANGIETKSKHGRVSKCHSKHKCGSEARIQSPLQRSTNTAIHSSVENVVREHRKVFTETCHDKENGSHKRSGNSRSEPDLNILDAKDSLSHKKDNGEREELHTNRNSPSSRGKGRPRSKLVSGKYLGSLKKPNGQIQFYSRFECSHCQAVFNKKRDFNNHIATHYFRNPHICIKCGEGFLTRLELKGHKQQAHTKVDKQARFSCDLCSAEFKTKGRFQLHKKLHEQNRLFLCKTCSFVAASKQGLNAHRLTHRKVAVKQCEYCGETKRVNNMQRHLRMHRGEKPYECAKCSVAFRTPFDLKNHVKRRHSEVKPFSCEICGKGFLCMDNLKHHLLVHSGRKPFRCSLCPSSFSRKDYLTKHIRTHTGERPYTCPNCKEAFAYPNSLKLHKKQCHMQDQENSGRGNGNTDHNVSETTAEQESEGKQSQFVMGACADVPPTETQILSFNSSDRSTIC